MRNTIKTTGNTEERSKFLSDFAAKGFNIIEEERPCSTKWRLENWGHEWNLSIDEHNEIEIEIESFIFNTFGPPKKWIEAVSKIYKDIEFTLIYFEDEYDGIAGRFTVKNGSITFDLKARYLSIEGFVIAGKECYDFEEWGNSLAQDMLNLQPNTKEYNQFINWFNTQSDIDKIVYHKNPSSMPYNAWRKETTIRRKNVK